MCLEYRNECGGAQSQYQSYYQYLIILKYTFLLNSTFCSSTNVLMYFWQFDESQKGKSKPFLN